MVEICGRKRNGGLKPSSDSKVKGSTAPRRSLLHNPATVAPQVLDEVRHFLEKHIASPDEGFAKANPDSVFLKFGETELILHRYRPAGTLVTTTDDLRVSRAVWNAVGSLPQEMQSKIRTALGCEIVQSLEADAAPFPKVQLYTLAELFALNLPPRKPVIEGMLHAGETVTFVGRQKTGKSRLTEQLSLDLVAAPGAFLGMPIPNATSVLLLDFENGLQSLSARLKKMGATEEGSSRLHVWCAQSLASDLPDVSNEGVARLRALVRDVMPDVLIVDPWRLFLAGLDENDARSVIAGLKALASLRQIQPQLSILIVHHLRKERYENPKRLLEDPALWVDAVSGHHALMGHVDAVYGLERQFDETGSEVIVFGGIARNLDPRTLILEDDESLRFKVTATESAAMQLMTPAQSKIWNAAKGLRRFTYTELLAKAETTNRKACSKALDTAEHHGLLRRQGRHYVIIQTPGAAQ